MQHKPIAPAPSTTRVPRPPDSSRNVVLYHFANRHDVLVGQDGAQRNGAVGHIRTCALIVRHAQDDEQRAVFFFSAGALVHVQRIRDKVGGHAQVLLQLRHFLRRRIDDVDRLLTVSAPSVSRPNSVFFTTVIMINLRKW